MKVCLPRFVVHQTGEMRLAAAIRWYKRGEISQRWRLGLPDWIVPISSSLWHANEKMPSSLTFLISTKNWNVELYGHVSKV